MADSSTGRRSREKKGAGPATLTKVVRGHNRIYLTPAGASNSGAPRLRWRPDTLMRRRHRFTVLWGYARFLAREFRWPMGIFLAIVLGGGAPIHLPYTPAKP